MSCGSCQEIIEASSRVTPCECPAAGYCARHKCDKPPHFAMLCRTHIAYYQQYERGQGPGQNIAPLRYRLGLGDVLAGALLKLARGDEQRLTAIGIRFDKWLARLSRGKFKANTDGTCKCAARTIWLNEHFPLWPLRWPWAWPWGQP